MFYKFSVAEGKICEEYHKAHNLPESSEFFWQLLMEKEFLCLVLSKLSPSVSSVESTVPSYRKITNVEENAVPYTAGFVLQKIEKKYECQKTDQCITAVREMADKLSSSFM